MLMRADTPTAKLKVPGPGWRRLALDVASPAILFLFMMIGWATGDAISHFVHPHPSDRLAGAFIIAGVAVVTGTGTVLLERYTLPRRRWLPQHLVDSAILYPMLAVNAWGAVPMNGGHISGLFLTFAVTCGAGAFTNGLVLLGLRRRDRNQEAR